MQCILSSTTVYDSILHYIIVISQYTTVYHSVSQYISIHSISQYTTVYITVYHSTSQYTTVYITVHHSIPQYTTVHHRPLEHPHFERRLFPVVPEYWDDDILPPCGTAAASSEENITEWGRGRRGGRRGPNPICMCACEERHTSHTLVSGQGRS